MRVPNRAASLLISSWSHEDLRGQSDACMAGAGEAAVPFIGTCFPLDRQLFAMGAPVKCIFLLGQGDVLGLASLVSTVML